MEDEPTKTETDIVIGEPLDRFSVAELDDRIARFRAEIARHEAARQAKEASAAAAESMFKS